MPDPLNLLAYYHPALVPQDSQADQASKLPDGDAKAIILSKCTVCHTVDRIVESHRSQSEWNELVGMMIDFGADVNDQEKATIVNYLAKNFPAQGEGGATSQGAAGGQASTSEAPSGNAGNASAGSEGARPPASYEGGPTSMPQAGNEGAGASGNSSSGAASSQAPAGSNPSLETQAPGESASDAKLPPGPAKQLILTKCTVCHTTDRIVESRRSPEEWNELVGMMIDFGADVNEQDKKTIVDYLSKNFPSTGSSGTSSAPQQ